MIFTTLADLHRYAYLHPRFAAAFTFLDSFTDAVSLGRHDLEDDHLFALVQEYETKALDSALFEAHRRYIDVQFVHSGRETILWTPLPTFTEATAAYDAGKDVALFRLNPLHTPLHLSAGSVAILYPEDAHSPCLHWDTPATVRKVVVKVAIA